MEEALQERERVAAANGLVVEIADEDEDEVLQPAPVAVKPEIKKDPSSAAAWPKAEKASSRTSSKGGAWPASRRRGLAYESEDDEYDGAPREPWTTTRQANTVVTTLKFGALNLRRTRGQQRCGRMLFSCASFTSAARCLPSLGRSASTPPRPDTVASAGTPGVLPC